MTCKMSSLGGTALSSLEEFALLLFQCCSENKLPGNEAAFGAVSCAREDLWHDCTAFPCSLLPAGVCLVWMCVPVPFCATAVTQSCLRHGKPMPAVLLKAFLKFMGLLWAPGPDVFGRVYSAERHPAHAVVPAAGQVLGATKSAFTAACSLWSPSKEEVAKSSITTLLHKFILSYPGCTYVSRMVQDLIWNAFSLL